jgi:hypothetical protein
MHICGLTHNTAQAYQTGTTLTPEVSNPMPSYDWKGMPRCLSRLYCTVSAVPIEWLSLSFLAKKLKRRFT